MFRRMGAVLVAACVLGVCGSAPVQADDAVAVAPAPEFDSGAIAWMLTSSALVLMMTAPGLALFYGGLVRKKNVLSVFAQCVFLMGIMTTVWGLWGYSLAFGNGGAYIGNLDHVLLKGVIPFVNESGVVEVPGSGDPIPTALFMMFQGMFFIITPALICGAFAERMKFSAMCVFSILWGTLIYCPVCHWVWHSDGWLAQMGALDFAGGTVVHILSGVSALVCAVVIGKRLGFGQEPMPPHNLTYTTIGAAMLWMGWFGFNGGSAGAADHVAVNAFVATQMAAAAGVIGWSLAEWIQRGHPSLLGACSGAVAGLVCITPAAGAVTPVAGLILGLAAGLVCYWACTTLKNKLKYDDSLDAFGVHGVGGTLGALLTGVFASKSVTYNFEDGSSVSGLLEGNAAIMGPQIYGVLATVAMAVVGTLILLKILDVVMGLRVTQDDEIRGLDLSQHGEEGYIFF